jgi:hypothetical protein
MNTNEKIMTPAEILSKIIRIESFKRNMLSQRINEPKVNIIYKAKWGQRLRGYEIKILEQAKTEWCRKQRANCCANARIDTAWYKGEPSSLIDANSILNAPEP